MPRTEPKEDAEFPVYKVRAVCANKACGRKGWTKALRPYPKGTEISTLCRDCIGRWEARVEALGPPLKLVTPERKPFVDKPHWTEKLP